MKRGRKRKGAVAAREVIQRQWHLLRELPRFPRTVTTGEIVRRLAANGICFTRRTVERDLVALSGTFPIMADERKKPYAWSWTKDAPAFSIPGLTNAQALALKLLEQRLEGQLPESITHELRPYFAAADAVLAVASQHSRLPAWIKKVRVVQPTQKLLPPKIDAGIQRTVYEALLTDRQLNLSYKKRAATVLSSYVVHPFGIIQRGPVTYLVCLQSDQVNRHRDPMQLAMHRIQSASLLEEPSIIPRGFDLGQYEDSGAAHFGQGGRIRLEVAFSEDAAKHLYEAPLNKDQCILPYGTGRVRVTATVADTPQLLWWLLGFGDQVEVLKPKVLRAQMVKIVHMMVKRYR